MPILFSDPRLRGGDRDRRRNNWKVFDRMTQIEVWGRKITGTVFLLVGIYLSVVHIFKVF
jgi:hypothetical protein